MEDIKKEETVPMTAGEMLRNARTTGRRKREIQTIAKQLCIKEEFLQALEDGNYTKIPEIVYILGFARNYAMELGLNPAEIVAKIKQEMCIVEDTDELVAFDAPSIAERRKTRQTKDDDNIKAKIAQVWQRAWTYTVKHWQLVTGIALGVIAIIAVIWIVAVAVSSDNSTSTQQGTEDTSVVAPVYVEPDYTMPVRERFGTENREKAVIILQSKRESWLKIVDARGKTVFSRVLLPGDVYYVSPDGVSNATFGDAGGMDVWVNGKLAPKQGADHKRKTDVVLSVDKLMATGGAKAEAKESAKAKDADKADTKTATKTEKDSAKASEYGSLEE